MAVLVAAAACASLRIALREGQIVLPDVPWLNEPGILAYVVVPMLVWRGLGGDPLRCLGPGAWRGARLVPVTAAVLVISALIVVVRLQRTEPGLPWDALALVWTTTFCTEFFFRGFLLLPLADVLGWLAVGVHVVPYAIVHAGKPVWELFGSIVFGLATGWLALRTGSILYGFVLHGGLATLGALALGY